MISTEVVWIVTFYSCFCFLFTFCCFESTFVCGDFCLLIFDFDKILKINRNSISFNSENTESEKVISFLWISFRVEAIQSNMYNVHNIYDGVHCDINVWKLFTSVTKSSILDVVWGPRYTTAIIDAISYCGCCKLLLFFILLNRLQ